MVLFYVKDQMSGNRTHRRDLSNGNIDEDDFSFQYMDAKVPKYGPYDQTHEKRQAKNVN